MLAVWRAGAVCLPFDPAAPAERTAFVLEDSGAALVLDDTARLPESAGLDTPAPAPDQLAYIIYTSGTTGRPKGVGVAHGPLASHIAAIRDRFGIGAQDVVLHFAKPTVDVAVEQLLMDAGAPARPVIALVGRRGTR